MVSSQFDAILKQFEAFFKCHLEPDSNDSCLIKMANGVSIQIELDRFSQVLIGCRVGSIPMSRYRDNLIQEALKSNAANLPSTGVFGFSQKSNHLILFIKISPDRLTAHQISSLMQAFIRKAKQWVDAIAKGDTPKVGSASSSLPAGLFGLISK